MKEQLQLIIDMMQAIIDARKENPYNDQYISGYADACTDFIKDLQELKETIQ